MLQSSVMVYTGNTPHAACEVHVDDRNSDRLYNGVHRHQLTNSTSVLVCYVVLQYVPHVYRLKSLPRRIGLVIKTTSCTSFFGNLGAHLMILMQGAMSVCGTCECSRAWLFRRVSSSKEGMSKLSL